MNTTSTPDFEIKSTSPISQAFKAKNIFTFKDATKFITDLPYRRNTDKNNLLTVFSDHCGTCGTKHALLKQLAIENNFNELRFMVGIFKMNAENTPEVAVTLSKNKIEYIPEAHNYLRYEGRILDFTKPDFKLSKNEENLLTELELAPDQITDYKVAFHKNFLKNWLTTTNLSLSPEELWLIKEECIANLSGIYN